MPAYTLTLKTPENTPFNYGAWENFSSLPNSSNVDDNGVNLFDFVQLQNGLVWTSVDKKMTVIFSGLVNQDSHDFARYYAYSIDAATILAIEENPMIIEGPIGISSFGVSLQFWI